MFNIKSYTSSQSKIPTVKIIYIQFGNAVNISVVIYIFDIRIGQISCISPTVNAEIFGQVHYGQYRQLNVSQVKTVLSITFHKVAVVGFIPLYAIKQFRLNG